jgi:hypothetical protein
MWNIHIRMHAKRGSATQVLQVSKRFKQQSIHEFPHREHTTMDVSMQPCVANTCRSKHYDSAPSPMRSLNSSLSSSGK